MHDPNTVLMGVPLSSVKKATSYKEDAATFEAGLACRIASGGALSLSSGALVGVSLGRDIADASLTSVARTGFLIPLQLKDEGVLSSFVSDDITYSAKAKGVAGDDISIELLDTLTDGTAKVTVTGKKVSVEIEAATTPASAIKAAIEGDQESSALIDVAIASGQEAVGQGAKAEAHLANGANSFDYAVIGTAVKLDTTGKAASTGTLTDAIYRTGAKNGILVGHSEMKPCVLVDMQGGL